MASIPSPASEEWGLDLELVEPEGDAREALFGAVHFLLDAHEASRSAWERPSLDPMFEVGRRLVAASFFLRTAHELHLALGRVPPERLELVQFVRLARHVYAHFGRPGRWRFTGQPGFLAGDRPEDLVLHLQVRLAMDPAMAAGVLRHVKEPDLQAACAFAARHDNDWFQSLVDAVRETATWIGVAMPELVALASRRIEPTKVQLQIPGGLSALLQLPGLARLHFARPWQNADGRAEPRLD